MWEWQHEEGLYEADIWVCHWCRDRDQLLSKLRGPEVKDFHRWGKQVRFFPRLNGG